jgi:hypothetical protein
MFPAACDPRHRFCGFVVVVLLLVISACGTLQVSVNETATPGTPFRDQTSVPTALPTPVGTATSATDERSGTPREVVAWYGSIHSVPGADPHNDYLKLWHLCIWHKYGRAVGIYGDSPAIDAEIDRVRDRDTRVTVWGTLACGVGDYGACQLRVTRFSANDGGPTFDPEQVEGWEGTIGWLPGPPGSQDGVHLFVLSGEIPVLYGITSADPSIQEQFGTLQDTTTVVRIWGELRSRVQPTTGTLIDVKRLEITPATPSP